jgi:hypothetical protein
MVWVVKAVSGDPSEWAYPGRTKSADSPKQAAQRSGRCFFMPNP